MAFIKGDGGAHHPYSFSFEASDNHFGRVDAHHEACIVDVIGVKLLDCRFITYIAYKPIPRVYKCLIFA